MSSLAHDVNTPAPENSESPPARKSFWHSVSGAILLAVSGMLLVFLVSSTADLLMLREHEPARFTIELSDGVAAGAIGLLCYKLVRLHQERREQVRQRLETIANMNHHVRNALQVISLTAVGKDKEEITAIRESVNRIQWALRELLPKI